jgi:hypothetical protein
MTTEQLQYIGCSIKHFQAEEHLLAAAEHAVDINPANAPARLGLTMMATFMAPGAQAPVPPLAIAMLTQKYWSAEPRVLTVGFLETTGAPLRTRIISHMNAWGGSLTFRYTRGRHADVRISRGPGGYWSYLGTDILLVPADEPTMNLESFAMSTPESEYRRVVRHETGHTRGYPHEHMRRELVARIDPARAIDYFERHYGWSAQMTRENVLTALEDATLTRTPADVTSIMCYDLPGAITYDGKPIPGGLDIDKSDLAFDRRMYPAPKPRNIA